MTEPNEKDWERAQKWTDEVKSQTIPATLVAELRAEKDAAVTDMCKGLIEFIDSIPPCTKLENWRAMMKGEIQKAADKAREGGVRRETAVQEAYTGCYNLANKYAKDSLWCEHMFHQLAEEIKTIAGKAKG